MYCEVANRAEFSSIRYAQCWEDADILLDALDIQPGDTCLSIASAGDNTLALLSRAPARVVALDLNPAQLACLELRVAAYRSLSHAELLELLGSSASSRRAALYHRCRGELSPGARTFWDSRPALVQRGTGRVGKFERYLALFRRFVLPLAHPRSLVCSLFHSRTRQEREQFYDQQWNTPRWNLLLRLFCSRLVMGRLGRDPGFFAYAERGVSGHLLARIRHVLTALAPAENPYLQWIVTGQHGSALPFALRPENFEPIRANLDRLEWHCQSLEGFLAASGTHTFDRYNLSNIFEYMSLEGYHRLLEHLSTMARPGARLAYWNMLVPRTHTGMRCLRPLDDLAQRLHQQDKAFFYSRFRVEEVAA